MLATNVKSIEFSHTFMGWFSNKLMTLYQMQ
jgi:hypothetical protein